MPDAPAVFDLAKLDANLIRPVGKRILVRRDVPPSVTEAGIVIADGFRSPQHTAIVVASGIDSVHRAGQRVMFAQYAGVPVGDATVKDPLLIMTDEEVIAVIDPANPA